MIPGGDKEGAGGGGRLEGSVGGGGTVSKQGALDLVTLNCIDLLGCHTPLPPRLCLLSPELSSSDAPPQVFLCVSPSTILWEYEHMTHTG